MYVERVRNGFVSALWEFAVGLEIEEKRVGQSNDRHCELTPRGTSVPRYRLGSPLPRRSTVRGAKAYSYRPRGRNDCRHNHLRSLPVKASPGALWSPKFKDEVLLPAWYS